MEKKQLMGIRLGVSSFYFVMGLVFASWASRIPDVKNNLGLDDGALGSVLFAIPIGQFCMMFFSGFLVNRFGSRLILLTATSIYAAVLSLMGLSQNYWMLFFSLYLFGIASNMANIATNTQACGVEALYSRNIMATFHGLWSLGGFLGGVVGALFASFGFTTATHFFIISILCLFILATASRFTLKTDEAINNGEPSSAKKKIMPELALILLGVIGFGSLFCEGTMYDWSSVYFATIIRPDEKFIRLGYIVSMCAMTLGRFLADRFVTRYHADTVLRFCGMLIFTGLLLATLLPNLFCATLGFLLVGLGVSSIIPICYSTAAKVSKMPTSLAITVVSSVSFFGFLIGPPLIGVVSKFTDLRVALMVASLFGIIIIAASKGYRISARSRQSEPR